MGVSRLTEMYTVPRRELSKRALRFVAAAPGSTVDVARCISLGANTDLSDSPNSSLQVLYVQAS